MKSLPASLFLILLLPLLLASARTAQITGGWKSISDLNRPDVIEMAKLAVGEFNRQTNVGLTLQNVISAKTQFVPGGISYCLDLSAENGTSTSNFQAFLLLEEEREFIDLISFIRVP